MDSSPCLSQKDCDELDSDSGAEETQEAGESSISDCMPLEVTAAEYGAGIRPVPRFKTYTLQAYDFSPSLLSELSGLQQFFTCPPSPLRRSRAWSSVTFEKRKERILGYLGWLKESRRAKHPTLEHFRDYELYLVKYVEGYLQGIRRLAIGTVVNHLTAAVDVMKYLYRTNTGPRPLLRRYLDYRNRIQTVYYREREAVSHVDRQAFIHWPDFLKAVHKAKVSIITSLATDELSVEQMYAVQDLTVLLLYACIPPARGKEYYSLLWHSDQAFIGNNYLYEKHEVFYISLHRFKNAGVKPDIIMLPSTVKLLNDCLRFLRRKHRHMLSGCWHSGVFKRPDGSSFSSASSWSAYIETLVRQYSQVPGISIDGLRHSFITWMKSSHCAQSIQESVAHCMRHSSAMQDSYNYQTQLEKKQEGVQFAAEAFNRSS